MSRIALPSGLKSVTTSLREALNSKERAPERPLGLSRRYLRMGQARIAYLDDGQGPPVLLLHGAPVTSLGFLRVIRELQSRHRVIAPDLPGFGASEVPAGFEGSLEAYARFIREFCEALELEGMVMYVNDSSGCMGLYAAADMPKRVAGLVVADTVPLPLTGLAAPVKWILRYVVTSDPMRWLNRRLNLLPWLVAHVAPLLRLRPLSSDERRTLVQQFDTGSKRDRILDIFGQMARDESFMAEAGRRAREDLAAVPALVLYGQFDPVRFAGGVRRFQRTFERSVVRILPWEEHFPILSSGEAVATLVSDWMEEHVGSESRVD